ncbi:2-hydroxy-3-oxopropionate reductase [Mollisia scopiformis]|uniref:3-hydroxyisobutyrate dehydrogenase n=1 Tax=Mollisia scopiformis TaxID=149040 RepID=A0A194WTR3_MOLSC|nr:2-hydroxy-3-oxopropionate reductase [Mollisia scopiformis]KUJ11341.1 2-hydroxy-3-oxopropionate reductase [Mollisia scopiformis]
MPKEVNTIGFIGLGNAGYHLAVNLPRAGFNLVVRDADPSRAQTFVDENPKSVAAGEKDENAWKEVDVLITMLPNGDIVREVLLGEAGVAKYLRPGTIAVDMSSSSPFDTEALNSKLKAMELPLIDAPITQTHLHAIRTGDATFMLGCDSPEVIERAMPVFKAMGKYVFPMGKSGAGHAMKTLNNYVSVGSIIALCDSLVAGQKFGLDPATMIDVLNVGTGRNFSTAYSMRDEGLTRRYQSGYQLALLIKDMKITKDVIKSTGFETGLPQLALSYLEDAIVGLEDSADHTECLKGWERRSGIELKKSAQPTESVVEEKVL